MFSTKEPNHAVTNPSFVEVSFDYYIIYLHYNKLMHEKSFLYSEFPLFTLPLLRIFTVIEIYSFPPAGGLFPDPPGPRAVVSSCVRYPWLHMAGVLVCVLGVRALILADVFVNKYQSSSKLLVFLRFIVSNKMV